MATKEKIKFAYHIPMIIALLVLQFFSSDIFSYFYLKKVENKLSKLHSVTGKFYRHGEYKPRLKENSPFRVPKNYVYAFVNKDGDITEETYYTKDGTKVVALYSGDKIVKVSGASGPKTFYFIIPIIGFLLILFANLREAARSGNIFSWQLGRSPDHLEKICYLYGVPFFGISIFIVIVKEVWLKGI